MLLTKKEKPRVAFALNQGAEAYALIVAVLNISGAFCPLDISAPRQRQREIIAEFGTDVFVVDSNSKPDDFGVVATVTIESLVSGNEDGYIRRDYNPEDLVYVIYTSGTTGHSKGVMICRKALNKFLQWSIPTYSASKGDIWGQFSSLSFDLSIVDVFTCLCSGATLYAMNDLATKKSRPASVIEKAGITIWHSVPSAVEFMMVNERAKSYDFDSLRLMSFCGEPLRKHQIEFLFGKNSNLTIFNTYGPTEGTLFCTWEELKAKNYREHCDITMSIGKAIPGWELRLDSIEGMAEKEIIIYGDYIGCGYLGNVTDNKFFDLAIEGATVPAFRTGDLVREVDGRLYFSCRKDRQVKVKGFRIELEEIDLRVREFLECPCATVLRDGILYTFAESQGEIDVEGLRNYLGQTLEPFKIPNAFYGVSAIPRNRNQKIDYNALVALLP
jgi:D-alanine--poly(phosphoribitol) ligase subunit 1